MTSGSPVGLQRAEGAQVVEHRDATLVIGPDGHAHRFPGDSGALVAELMRLLGRPRTRPELDAALAARFDAVAEAAATVDAALEHLAKAGALKGAHHHAHPPRAVPSRNLVLGLTGAVSTALSPVLAAQLVAAGFKVRVAMTRAAGRFVQPLALESITHEPVVRGLWHRSSALPVPHLNLAEWAQAVLVCPASATTLSRLAHGDCSDLVSAVAIATKAPVVLVPSMNAAMFDSPSVRRNCELLAEDGFHLVLPGVGHEVAHAPGQRSMTMGPMPHPREVVALLEAVLSILPPSAQMQEWDGRFREWKAEEMPWHSETLDADLVDLLSVLPRPSSVLDVGTGLGTVARELARRGLSVTATDLSSVALSRAQAVCAGQPVRLVHDDIVQTRLTGPFDLVLDRAVLHLLPVEHQAGWAASVARLTPKGGHLVVKVHSPEEPRFNTQKLSPEALEKLVGPAFETVRISQSTLPGTVSPAPKALLGLFRRI